MMRLRKAIETIAIRSAIQLVFADSRMKVNVVEFGTKNIKTTNETLDLSRDMESSE